MNPNALRCVTLVLGAAFSIPVLLPAQGAGESAGSAVFAGVLEPEPPFAGYAADVPVPPKALLGTLSGHVDPPLQIGPHRPGPDSAPIVPVDPRVDTGLFRWFQLEDVTPSGASTSIVGEPSVAETDHVVFQTGNWYGARSLDNGASWTHVSPYTFFGSVDGGFCCDQRIIYIPSHDITVWVLQYSYSSTTGTAGYRIAVANGDADLANPSASAWTSYILRPQTFAFAAGTWFDFPDIAFSNDGFFLSANVYNASSRYQGTALIRTTLAGLQANGSIPLSYINSMSHGLGFTPRMAQGGSGDRIFWGSVTNSSTMQVGYFTDVNTYSHVSRSIGSLSFTVNSTPSPDGVNWAARDPGRFRGAYGNASEVGFLTTSGPNGAGRPNPYIRVERFTADHNRTLIAEQDLWHGSLALTYGAAATNSLGHVGLVFAAGSSTSYVSSWAAIIDGYSGWSGLPIYSMGGGQSSPNQNRWGDYFEVRRHHVHPATFIGTGMRQIGGSGNGNNRPQFAWFGRDDYEPTWVNLTVQSTPMAGVPITIAQTDLDGQKDGATTFTRRFAPFQPYTVTAPASVFVGRTLYLFQRWRYAVVPGGGFIDGPIGELTLGLSSIGSLDDTAEAVYVLSRSLTVQSANPSSGVSITVSPNDVNGSGSGTTAFTRQYRDGEVVSLTAPDTVGFNPFRRWTVAGASQGPSRAISVTMDSTKTAVAEYWTNVAGSAQSIGAGCPGSNRGAVPAHTVSWGSGQQGPQQGLPTTYGLALARPLSGAALNVGLSNRIFNGLRLPLDLGMIGVTGCNLYHDLISSQSLTTDRVGRASFPITWPADPASIGVPIFSSFTIIDIGVPRPLPLTLSNAMETRPGGNQ